MKDAANEILISIFNLLDGSLAYDGINYPVYSCVPIAEDFNYVYINSINLSNDSTKDSYISEVAILFDVVTGGFSNRGSWKAANSIANQLQELIVKKELLFTNFKINVLPYLDSNVQFEEKLETELLLRKELRYIFSVKQL